MFPLLSFVFFTIEQLPAIYFDILRIIIKCSILYKLQGHEIMWGLQVGCVVTHNYLQETA
jgi:hypothetical protein